MPIPNFSVPAILRIPAETPPDSPPSQSAIQTRFPPHKAAPDRLPRPEVPTPSTDHNSAHTSSADRPDESQSRSDPLALLRSPKVVPCSPVRHFHAPQPANSAPHSSHPPAAPEMHSPAP